MRGVLSERVLKHSYGGSVMDKRILSTALLLGSLIAAPLVHADSPPNIKTPDTHSVEAKGKVALNRVQIQGLEFGKDRHTAAAEVLVSLDRAPDDVNVIRLHEDSPPIIMVMADTLRDAFLSQSNVTLYYQKIPDRKNLNIHVVQLNKYRRPALL